MAGVDSPDKMVTKPTGGNDGERVRDLTLQDGSFGGPLGDLLDGSVGIRWSQHRKGKPWERGSKTYIHSFPDRRGEQTAKAYHLDELAEFDKWLRNIYIPRYLPGYLDGKYSLPVPARTMIARVMSGKVIAEW